MTSIVWNMVNLISLCLATCCTQMIAPVSLICGRAACKSRGGMVNMMYRVLVIAGGAFALAACSTPDWMSFDSLKPGPSLDSVSMESEPPGAEAKASNGQTCRTPCSLALPINAPMTITFTLAGYQPETERLEVVQSSGDSPRLGPNPVVVELSPAAPAPNVAKKPPAKKPAPKKPARPASAAAPAAPMTASPAQPTSPWPNSAPPVRQ